MIKKVTYYLALGLLTFSFPAITQNVPIKSGKQGTMTVRKRSTKTTTEAEKKATDVLKNKLKF